MSDDTSSGMSGLAVACGWVALAALLGLIVRTMRKSAPVGQPQLVDEFRKVWSRSPNRFAIHADLPRLARKVYIHTRDNKTLAPPDSALLAIKKVVLGLAEQLLDWKVMSAHKSAQIKQALDESFPDSLGDQPDLQLTVRQFMDKHSELLGESIIGLIKALTQDIIAPGVIKMKRQLSAQMPYKDKRGEWYIHISFQHKDIIMVSHRKTEQSFSFNEDGQDFEFQWNLDLIYDKHVTTLMDSALYIPTLTFAETATEETKSRITLLLDDYTRM